jgi:hypothetical protein
VSLDRVSANGFGGVISRAAPLSTKSKTRCTGSIARADQVRKTHADQGRGRETRADQVAGGPAGSGDDHRSGTCETGANCGVGDELNAIFRECATDKGARHSYGIVYEFLLRDFRNRPFTLLELGVGSGGSLRAWERYCPRAKIIASDIDPAARKFASPRTAIEIVDHHDRAALAGLQKHAPLDFIIDDGDHKPCAVRTAYDVLWPLLRVGGVYVIEDLEIAHDPAYHPETGPIFDGIAARLAAENIESGLTDRMTILAGELAAFVKVR